MFSDRREASGWLTARWATAGIGVVVWAWLAALAADVDTPATAAAAVLSVALFLVLLWGRRASADVRPTDVEAVGHRSAGRWRRERRAVERAADRLGWSPALAVAVDRTLLAAGLALLLLAAAVFTRGQL